MGAASYVDRRWLSSAEGITALWAGILAGPIAWAADLGISYALVKWTCGHQHTTVLHLITVGALVATAAGAFAAWRVIGELSREPATDPPPRGVPDERSIDRARFMAALGLLSSGLFALVIIATAVPKWVLDACQ